jgi:hypothetical protein
MLNYFAKSAWDQYFRHPGPPAGPQMIFDMLSLCGDSTVSAEGVATPFLDCPKNARPQDATRTQQGAGNDNDFNLFLRILIPTFGGSIPPAPTSHAPSLPAHLVPI